MEEYLAFVKYPLFPRIVKAVIGGQRAEIGGQMSEVRNQRSEGEGQKDAESPRLKGEK
jgi:hypothetical protein